MQATRRSGTVNHSALGQRRSSSRASPSIGIASRSDELNPVGGHGTGSCTRASRPPLLDLASSSRERSHEPVALSSTRPPDLPLPRRGLEVGFDLLALRARCEGRLMTEVSRSIRNGTDCRTLRRSRSTGPSVFGSLPGRVGSIQPTLDSSLPPFNGWVGALIRAWLRVLRPAIQSPVSAAHIRHSRRSPHAAASRQARSWFRDPRGEPFRRRAMTWDTLAVDIQECSMPGRVEWPSRIKSSVRVLAISLFATPLRPVHAVDVPFSDRFSTSFQRGTSRRSRSPWTGPTVRGT